MKTKIDQPVGRGGVALGTLMLISVVALAGCSVTDVKDGNADASVSPSDIPDGDGPGVTADTITIVWDGMVSRETNNETQSEVVAAKQSVVAELNNRGGIAGRKVIIPDAYPAQSLLLQRTDAYNAAGGLDIGGESTAAETCKALGEKEKFFAHIGQDLFATPLGTPRAARCTNKAGHVVIAAPSTWTAEDYAAAPFTAGIGVRADRLVDAHIAAAADAGLEKQESLVLLADSTAKEGSNDRYVEAFRKAGYSKVSMASIDPNATPADAVNLVVKLRGEGVKNVAFIETGPGGSISGLILDALGQQQFAPKVLTVNDTSVGTAESPLTDEVAKALRSYTTKRDYFQPTPAQAAATNATPAGNLCNAATKQFSPDTRGSILSLCDGLSLLKAALEAGDSTSGLNAKTFSSGIAALKDTYNSPLSFGTSFSETQHDGTAAIVKSMYDPATQDSTLDDKPVRF